MNKSESIEKNDLIEDLSQYLAYAIDVNSEMILDYLIAALNSNKEDVSFKLPFVEFLEYVHYKRTLCMIDKKTSRCFPQIRLSLYSISFKEESCIIQINSKRKHHFYSKQHMFPVSNDFGVSKEETFDSAINRFSSKWICPKVNDSQKDESVNYQLNEFVPLRENSKVQFKSLKAYSPQSIVNTVSKYFVPFSNHLGGK